MMKRITHTLFTGWHFRRWLYLVMGIVLIIQSIQVHELMLLIPAILILVMALVNQGCCGANGCRLPSDRDQKD